MNNFVGYMEGTSIIHKSDPFIKLICLLLLITSIVFCDCLLGYVILISVIVLLILKAHISWGSAIQGVKQLWLFFVVIFLMNCMFFESETVLWKWWLFQLSIEGIVQGASVITRVILSMIVCHIFMLTTSPLDMIDAIESLFFPLQYVGVPIHDIAMILGVSLQFIPMLAKETDMIKKAQIARGAHFESRKLLEKAKSVIPLIVPIFLAAFQRADELSIAMESRGYHHTQKKRKWKRRKICFTDISLIVISIGLCAIQILL